MIPRLPRGEAGRMMWTVTAESEQELAVIATSTQRGNFGFSSETGRHRARDDVRCIDLIRTNT